MRQLYADLESAKIDLAQRALGYVRAARVTARLLVVAGKMLGAGRDPRSL